MRTSTPVLSPQQREHFLEHGYIKLEAGLDPAFCRAVVERQFAAQGLDPADPDTWGDRSDFRIQATEYYNLQELAPGVWAAACELLGAADRIAGGTTWSDMLIVNACAPGMTEWRAPGDKEGWHKDGYFFRHFLDSPEQGLLGIILWSDVQPRGGGTFIAPDSVGAVARHLAAHPEGLHPNRVGAPRLMKQCPRRIEVTGTAGDVFLLHPYMLHTRSHNPHRKLRCISNPLWTLREPMRFNRPDPADFSLVEQAVLRGLGEERLDFAPARERVSTSDLTPLPIEHV